MMRTISKKALPVIAAVAATGLLLTSCSGGSSEEEAAPAELADGLTNVGVGHWENLVGVDLTDADPQIPEVDVKLAQAPFWDHSTEQIGIEMGYFADAGLTVQPEPSGTVIGMDQVAPQLLTGEIEVGTMVPQIWVASLDQGVTSRVFTSRDIMMGHAFLANPDLGFKSVGEFMEDGDSWDEAVTEAMGQLKGLEVYVSDEASPRSFRQIALDSAGMTEQDYVSSIMDDETMQQLALSGRAQVVSPASGPNIVTLISQGWVPVISTRDIVENGDAEQLLTVIVNTGLAAEISWLEANPETAMRLAGVSYRVLDLKKNDPVAAAEIQIPFINSIAGTSFTLEDAEILDNRIDPFYTFDEQSEFFEDEDSPFYWSKPLEATIEMMRKDGLVTGEDWEASDVSWADSTWLTLKSLKEKSEEIIAELDAAELSGKAADQLAQAKEFVEARNYLDAYRFANAAQLNA